MPRLAFVEDSRVKARLIEELFRNFPSYELVSYAATANEAQAIPTARPDIVLVDRVLPDGDGLELAADLSDRMPHARVYLYSSIDPPPLLPASVGYLRDESLAFWPQVLDPSTDMEAKYVRHPKKA